jgi:hypothetical protein
LVEVGEDALADSLDAMHVGERLVEIGPGKADGAVAALDLHEAEDGQRGFARDDFGEASEGGAEGWYWQGEHRDEK